ncbi:putative acyl-CoA transferase/carnitine dehydratase [Actinobacteria bacterium IMCC26207]|nr:putative acyl-CoA transferase/carnitine dehydratase [Actinobacteria bacterium IMCC26207]
MSQPALQNIRVLDLASVGPGARASRTLADYGAEVIKIGAVPRAGAVQIVPPYYAYSGNRNMKRAMFDLKADAGREAFLGLADTADVIIESFRPGVVARLGIGYEDVNQRNPRIVYCSTSGFGQTGPRSQWAGHDINYLATSGFLDCTGRQADGRPALPGATVADIAAGGMQASMAIMAALLGRATSGVGSYLDVSIADGAFALMSLYVDEYLATGVEPGPGHYILTGRYACYEIYTCSDGKHISVGAIEGQFWRNLCELLELGEFADAQLDDNQQDQIREALAQRFATRTRDEWVEILGAANTCVAPVNTVAEAVIDEQYVARGLVASAVSDTAGEFLQSAPTWAGTVAPDGPYQIRDGAVSDTMELLTQLGLAESEIAELEVSGAIA